MSVAVKKALRAAAISVLFCALAVCCLGFVFRSVLRANAALYDSGKYVINDYETYNEGMTGVEGKTAVSTEPCNPYGVMISTDNAYASWNNNFQHQPFKTDWTGAKYMLAYLHNKSDTAKAVQPLLSMHKNDGDRKHFYPTKGVYLDDMTAVTEATFEADGRVQIPAGFQGYIKIQLDPENFVELWPGAEAGVQDYSQVMQVHFFNGDKDLYADTVAISYDDDIQTPLTAEAAAFDRVLAGSNTFYAIKDYYWMMRGDDWFDGPYGAGARASYDAYGQYLTYNNTGNTAAVTMWQKDTLLTDWGLSNWDGAKYLVAEVRNNDAQNAASFGFKIDAGSASYNLNWYGDYLFRAKSGEILYRSSSSANGTNGQFIVPAGFDGYLIVDLRMFANANDFTTDNMLSNAIFNVKRVNLDFGTTAINLTFGRIGYAKSDLIRYNNSEAPIVFNDSSRYMSADAENELTPIASFLSDAVAEDMTGNMSNGVTVTKTDTALNFKGTPTANATAFVNSIADLSKLNTKGQSLLVLDIKNNLSTDSLFKPYVKTYNNDITDDMQDANYSVAYGARVHLLAKDASQAEMQVTADGITIPGNFEGYIIVPFSTLTESDTNTGRAFRADKIKTVGMMPLMPNAVDFAMRTPYFASSIRILNEQASVMKVAQNELAATSQSQTIAYGATAEVSVSGGQGSGAVTLSVKEGTDYAAVEDGKIKAIKAGGSVVVEAVKAADSYYAQASATVSFTTVKAVPQVTVSYAGEAIRGADASTLAPDVDSDVAGTIALEEKVLVLGQNDVAWRFTPSDTTNYETVTGTVSITAAMPAAESIAIVSQPTKTEYKTGEALDLTGLSVKVIYEDGTEEAVSVTAENVSGFDSSKAGQQTLTVTVLGKTATFTVTVTADSETKDPQTDKEGGCASFLQGVSAIAVALTLLGGVCLFAAKKKSCR